MILIAIGLFLLGTALIGVGGICREFTNASDRTIKAILLVGAGLAASSFLLMALFH